MGLVFRENPLFDVNAISALRRAVGWDERSEKLAKILGCTYMSLGCYDGDNLVAFVDVISDGVDDAFIRNLLVHPDYQRKGIARKLLKMVYDRSRKDGIKTVNVLFEPGLEELYRGAGFRIICGGIIDNEAEGQR